MDYASPPTTPQQLGMAYAPMPFASLSLLASLLVAVHIAALRPQKRGRMYHRLVLGMNLALIPLSLTYLLGSLAVPAGTPHYPAARGNQATCTAAGFVAIATTMTVPVYYSAFVLHSYLFIKNKFREEPFRWIEKWIHLAAWVAPCAIATRIAVAENFNPVGSGCSLAAAPAGCDADPDVECRRGGSIQLFVYILGFGQILCYFVFPPVGLTLIYRLIRRIQRKVERRSSQGGGGMRLVRENARRAMMRNVLKQISIYLVSFWATYVPTLVYFVILTVTGTVPYDLLIFAACVFASQGCVLAAIYFLLPRISAPKVESLTDRPFRSARGHLTVSTIRKAVQRRTDTSEAENEDRPSASRSRNSSLFCIFDGKPDPDSPWAQFIEADSDEDGEDNANEEEGRENINEEVESPNKGLA